MVDEFARHNNNRVSFAIEDINNRLSNEAQIVIYRIFQEALTNIGKHAGAKHISMNAESQKESISFVMEDDGRGFDINAPMTKNPDEKGFGLTAMEERARMLGASLDIWSRPGHGTKIAVVVPRERAKESQLK